MPDDEASSEGGGTAARTPGLQRWERKVGDHHERPYNKDDRDDGIPVTLGEGTDESWYRSWIYFKRVDVGEAVAGH
jgi:hypothetical protein